MIHLNLVAASASVLGFVIAFLISLTLPFLAIWLLFKVTGAVLRLLGAVFEFFGAFFGHIGAFIRRTARDMLQLVGTLLTAGVLLPVALAKKVLGRSGAATNYILAIGDELLGAGAALYRLVLGNPVRLIGLGQVAERLEGRWSELQRERPKPRLQTDGMPEFPGYQVTGTLPAGGSGARLFRALPEPATSRRWVKDGLAPAGEVVIKSFDLEQGSTLPQIVRESRALEAARRLGLVLDHQLDDESFWYSMPFVPGEDLDVVTAKLHAQAGPEGLDSRGLSKVLGLARDLASTLHHYHSGGLWHKDVKPSNLIVCGNRVHLVDLGLVTPLASAMTLTTHGTEYYRDPELVRLAMQGVKVHEVDGVKFDLYSAGAVLYSMVENSFPAHGSLSRLSRRCPDALAWIIRRSMADVDQRYPSAEEMGRDVDVLLASDDPYQVKPAQLPSMGGEPVPARAAAWLRDPAAPAPIFHTTTAGARSAARPLHRVSHKHASSTRSGARLLGAAAAGLVAFFLIAFVGSRAASSSRASHSRAMQDFSVASEHADLYQTNSMEQFHPKVTEQDLPTPDKISVTEGPTLDAVHVFYGGGSPFAQAGADVQEDGSTSRVLRPSRPMQLTLRAPGESGLDAESADGLVRQQLTLNARVLFLPGVGLERDSELLQQLRDSLVKRGMVIIGDSEDDPVAAIDLIAGARRAVELAQLDDPEASAELQRYLNERSEFVDAIIWLEPGPQEGSVSHRLFVPERPVY